MSLFRAWCDELKGFSARSRRQVNAPGLRVVIARPLPHLGPGAFLVTAFVSAFFVAALADALAIIVPYGPRAYFHDGLRIINWKHNLLSDGEYLSPRGYVVKAFASLVLWGAAIAAVDFCSMLIQRIIRRGGRWVGIAFRLFGGAALLAFVGYIYRLAHWKPGLHPIPLSASIGGAVLIWKGLVSIFANSIETPN